MLRGRVEVRYVVCADMMDDEYNGDDKRSIDKQVERRRRFRSTST